MCRRSLYIIALVAQLASSADATPTPIYRVPEMQNAPEIDGKIGTGEWVDTVLVTGLVKQDGTLSSRLARAWIGQKGDSLYVAIESVLPPRGDILAEVQNDRTDDSSELFSDDVTEFWLAPLSKNLSDPPAYRLATNASGSIYSSKHDPRANQGFSRWDCHPEIANIRHGGTWVTEMRLPLSDLETNRPDLTGLAFRVVRNWRQPTEVAATEPWGGAPFSNVPTMSRLLLDPTAPIVQLKSLGDRQTMRWAFSARNNQTKPQRIRVNLAVASTSSMPPKVLDQTLEVSPGGTVPFSLEADLFADVDCKAEMMITSADTGREIYHREFGFDTKTQAAPWQLHNSAEKLEATFYLAYSPSRNQLALKFSNLGADLQNAPLDCELRQVGNENLIASAHFSKLRAKDGAAYGLMDTPKLGDGNYEAECIFTLADGRKKTFKQHFERINYPWEGNQLGKSPDIPTGFAAIKIDETGVAVAKGYLSFGTTGLPKALNADGRPLLTGPIRLHGSSGGKHYEAEGKGFSLDAVAAARISGSASWTLGPFLGKTDIQLDYDGFLLCTLNMEASDSAVDELTLDIPLDNREAHLMHSVGAGIRGNYAGKIPAGEGPIWSNLEAVSYNYPNGFIPYLWMGGTRRGLSWCADSSTGWVIGKQRAALELLRNGERLTLRLHLISEKTNLTKSRQITFGLQMTPIKDLPRNWRRMDFVERFPGVETIRILGSCLYWGGISSFGDFYPRDHDFRILEQLYKATQVKTVTPEMKSFIGEWNKGNASLAAAEGLNRHVQLGFEKAATSDYLIPYTDTREIRESTPEFQTFQDEWVRQGFNARSWSLGNQKCVGTEATASFQDFALWNFKKMKDVRFARGIYFDNDFPVARSNPFLEYETAGQNGLDLKPPTGLYEVREYFKRTFQMFGAQGITPYCVVHMTNAALAPHLAFATFSLDWEMKYGASDFQDRFSEDYIFASSRGEQFGTIPLVLSGIFPSSEKTVEWLTRSLIGTTFPYELKIFFSSQLDIPTYKKVFDIIYGFGYGEKDCQVFHYWENPPFQPASREQRGILLKRGNNMLLMITDFGNGGTSTITFQEHLFSGHTKWTARDAESGRLLELRAHNLSVPLEKHQFRLIQITPSES